jgi:hypothetical protein
MGTVIRLSLAAALAATVLTGGVESGPSSASAAECVKPEPIPLPLSWAPKTRVEFKAYKKAFHAYQDCAGAEADPAVTAHYKKALAQWVHIVRTKGNSHKR